MSLDQLVWIGWLLTIVWLAGVGEGIAFLLRRASHRKSKFGKRISASGIAQIRYERGEITWQEFQEIAPDRMILFRERR